MDKKFLEVSQIKLRGAKEVEGMKFHEIEGGFGNGKKAMLVKEIANIHSRELGKINELINYNRIRFNDGIDIVDLKGTEVEILLKDNGIYTQNALNVSKNIYLLSERGYSKLLKILEDDVAWEQYEKLVDGYFNMRAEKKQLSAMDQLKLQYQVLEEHEEKLNRIEKKVNTEFSNLPLLGVDCDEIVKTVKSIATKALGGYQETPAYRDKSLNHKVYSDIYNQLKREFQVNSYKSIKRCQLEHAKEIVRAYKLPTALEDEIVQVNNQVYFEEV
ncbi:ORF6C domain-containing protein [Clostridium butyricum]|uniref:ORF6C domain-containing protein n=1 Tax=Clostridium butyricum TaxID=1492 RepID=UPI0018AC3B3B|nr:ORF6C domain-containing protein [Clostridium butyricum]MDB2139240.1 ORF6C domain-containing protein [Clostridium butyricum]